MEELNNFLKSKEETDFDKDLLKAKGYEVFKRPDGSLGLRRQKGLADKIEQLSVDKDGNIIRIENKTAAMPPVNTVKGPKYNSCPDSSPCAKNAVDIIENNNQFVWVEEKGRWFSPNGKRQIWFEDGWKYDGGSGVIEEFTVVKKYSIYKSSYKTTTTNSGAFMNGHHGIQSDWALKRINKLSQEVMHMDLYNPENAPVVLLRDTYSASPHRNITNLQAARKSQITKTNYLFQKKQAEFELRQIKCPDNEINIYLSNADKYFKSIYEILKNKIENSNFSDSQKKYFDGELQKIFGTYFTK